MSIDPRTPVLVGAGVAHQRHDDPALAAEPVELMALAAEAAADDAGSRALLGGTQRIAVPEGTWEYPDPGHLLAKRLGAASATSVLADVGVLQQALLTEVCDHIVAGELDVALVVGGEARHRAQRAKATGVVLTDAVQPDGTVPDRHVRPETLGIHDLEIVRNIVTPATAYALIEHARMHRLGHTPEEHRAELGALYETFAAVASANPDAWDRGPWDADRILTATSDNRTISTPYTRAMCSQWNVDQAAAVILCSVEAAVAFGINSDHWVFPVAATMSNHSVPVVQRPDLGRSPGTELAAERVLELAGTSVDDLACLDVYSCFPSAVQTIADALGTDPSGLSRPLTVTGGMSFAGGPLNNYVLQALVELVRRLRHEPGAHGLSSSVSGFLHKTGFGVWSASPPAEPFRHDDVTEEAAAHGPAVRPVAADHVGEATIVSWTVDHLSGEPHRAVVVCDANGDGDRTLASTGEPSVVAAMLDGDWVGRRVAIGDDGSFLPEG